MRAAKQAHRRDAIRKCRAGNPALLRRQRPRCAIRTPRWRRKLVGELLPLRTTRESEPAHSVRTCSNCETSRKLDRSLSASGAFPQSCV